MRPRVTEILATVGLAQDLSMVDPLVLGLALERGKLVHAAIEAHHYGYVDVAAIPPECAPYFSGYLKFLADSGHEPIHSEFEVVHPTWNYVGHPDRIGWLDSRRRLLDWKTAEAPDLEYAGDQLAGYVLAWNAAHPTERIDGAAVVQLKRDGTYRFHEIALDGHEQTFLAAVVLYRALVERGRMPA